VDINDIRIFLGIEGNRLNSLRSYVEVGYVFDREILYEVVPADNVRLKDTVMVGAGVAF
jgi:hypothetical protein